MVCKGSGLASSFGTLNRFSMGVVFFLLWVNFNSHITETAYMPGTA